VTEDPPQPRLTADQIVLLYEQQLNWASVWVLLSGFGGIAVGLALYWLLPVEMWVRVVAAAAVIVIGGGMLQRLFVLRVRCPACGARVLGRIHSIVQARGIKACPRCEAKLRQ